MPIAEDWVVDYVDKKISHIQFTDNLPGGSDSSVAEVVEIAVLAASSITTGDYFFLNSATDTTGYYVWYNKDSGAGDPALADKTGIEVAIATGDTNAVVATATRDAINTTAPANFTATVATNVVTITNDAKGSTTDAADSSGGTATDFTFDVTTQGKGKTVWSVNAFYSFLQDQIDEISVLEQAIPISAQTPTEYSIINGWFIDDESVKYLKGGAIKTSGYASGGIRVITMAAGGYTSPDAADIGTGVTQSTSGHTGKLLFFDPTSRKWWVRPTDPATDTFSTTNQVTIDGASTGEGTPTGAATSGEDLYSNIYTLGAIETTPRPATYIFQGPSVIPSWWDLGDAEAHIDVLIKVKEAGSLIEGGIITVFIRQYADLYDNFTTNLSAGGRNAVPLSSQTDSGSNTLGEAYILFDNQSVSFTVNKIVTGQTSGAHAEIMAIQDDGATGFLTLGNVVGTFANDETIKDDNATQGVAIVNGTIGDTVLNFDGQALEVDNFTTLGQIVTGALTGAKRALRGIQDDGTTGRLVLQVSDISNVDHYKIFSDNELITGSTNGSATSNGVSTTTAMGFSDVKVWFMNVEVNFSSKTGVISVGDAVTGAGSGATAIFLGEKDANTIMLGNWNSVNLTVGEQVRKDVSNYYVIDNPTGQTITHLINQNFQLQASYPYSVVVHGADRRVSEIYQWLKYITRENANISQINYQLMYPVVNGVVETQYGEEYLAARTTPDTPYTQAKASPIATFSGGKLFGAQGVWVQNADAFDAQAYQLVDSNGVIRNPPNFQLVRITGIATGDRVVITRTTTGNTANKAVFTATAGNNIGNTTFVVNEAIPADTPASGIIRIVDADDATSTKERRYSYTSWETSTFIGIVKTFSPSTAGLDRNYTVTADKAFVPYIDEQATSTEISKTIIYIADRSVVAWVRKYNGTNTIVPFETTGTFNSLGYQVTVIRTTDAIAT